MEHESQSYGQAVGDFEVVADFKIQVFEKVQVQFVEVDDAVRRNLLSSSIMRLFPMRLPFPTLIFTVPMCSGQY